MLRIFRGERRPDATVQPPQGAPADADGATAEQPAVPPMDGSTVTRPDATGTEKPDEQPTGDPKKPDEQPTGDPKKPDEQPTGDPKKPDEQPTGEDKSDAGPPGFLERGRMRRRARFLHAARELAYRDLGGLVFDLHRFGQRNDQIVQGKLDTLTRIDSELRDLQDALGDRKPVTVLRQAGVAACPRCAAIHGSGDRFCPTCGMAVDQAERPINAGHTVTPTPPAPAETPASVLPVPLRAAQVLPPVASPAPSPAPSASSARPPVPAPPTALPTSAPSTTPHTPAPSSLPTPAASTALSPTPWRPTPRPADALPPAPPAPIDLGPSAEGADTPPPPREDAARAGEREQPTEVIRPARSLGQAPPERPQRTMAFDPVSSDPVFPKQNRSSQNLVKPDDAADHDGPQDQAKPADDASAQDGPHVQAKPSHEASDGDNPQEQAKPTLDPPGEPQAEQRGEPRP